MTVVSPLDAGPVVGPPTGPRRSPLAGRAQEFATRATREVELAEEPFLAQINVRGDSRAAGRLGDALSVRVPREEPNAAPSDGTTSVLWLGPDEWLLVGPDGAAGPLLAAARAALDGGSVVDVSANRTTVRLRGPRSRDVLEKVCSLDLHPRAFGPGRCAQTLIGRTQAVLWQVDDSAYRLLVRCSFADYLADLLLDASADPA